MGNRRLLAWALVVALGGALLTATPAQATTTVLCSGYDSCARKGYTDHGYKEKRFNLYWRMAGDHNCTNYVASILVAKGMPNVRPWVGDGNAYAWGDFTTSYRDSTPVVGAVAWFDSNRAPHSSAGHVSYVEKVVSSSTIIVSEDNWKGEFRWKRITKSGGGWPSSFIHFRDSRTPPLPAFDASLVSQSVWSDSTKSTQVVPTELAPGSTAWVEVVYRNAGSKPWAGVTLQPTGPAGRVSAIASPAAQSPAEVRPGRVATFGFAVTIPMDAAPGTSWSERFSPANPAGTTLLADETALQFAAVAGTDFASRPRPLIEGVALQGQVLSANVGEWDADAQLSLSWRRNGLVIPGATAATYTATASDVGKKLTVSVSAEAAGRLDSVQTSKPTAFVSSTIPDRLAIGERLRSTQKLISANGLFEVVQRSDGNLVISDRRSGIPIWANAQASASSSVKFTSRGSLATYSKSGSVVWSSKTADRGATTVVLTNSGRLVIKNASGKVLWMSVTSGR